MLLEDQLHYVLIAVVTYVIAITNAFLVYRYLVFKSKGNIVKEYLKVYVVYGVSAAIGTVGLALLVELFRLHPIIAQGFVVLVTVVFSYVGHSRFTFSGKTGD